MSLEDLKCPGCGASKLIRDSDNTLTCSSCGNHYDTDVFVENNQKQDKLPVDKKPRQIDMNTAMLLAIVVGLPLGSLLGGILAGFYRLVFGKPLAPVLGLVFIIVILVASMGIVMKTYAVLVERKIQKNGK